MPARRKISARQMEILLEFAESNRDIALGRFSAGPLASQASRQAWESVAARLNSVAEGSTKTADQWRRYWIELKAKTRCKAADVRRHAARTGGGPSKLVPLTPMEERVLALIGKVAVEGLPGVRLPIETPPLTLSETPPSMPTVASSPQPSTSTLLSPEPPMEVEWLEDSPPTMGGRESPNITEQPTIVPECPSVPSPSYPQVEAESHAEVTHEELARPQEEEVAPLHEEQPQASSHPTPRRMRQRRVARDERVPRWAYELETRRLNVEENLLNLMRQNNESVVALMQQHNQNIVALMRQHNDLMGTYVQTIQAICEDIRSYLNRV